MIACGALHACDRIRADVLATIKLVQTHVCCGTSRTLMHSAWSVSGAKCACHAAILCMSFVARLNWRSQYLYTGSDGSERLNIDGTAAASIALLCTVKFVWRKALKIGIGIEYVASHVTDGRLRLAAMRQADKTVPVDSNGRAGLPSECSIAIHSCYSRWSTGYSAGRCQPWAVGGRYMRSKDCMEHFSGEP
jgi:hypothetical protein